MYKNPYEIRFCNLISVSLDMFMAKQNASRAPSCMIPQRGDTLKMIFLPVTGHFIDVFLYLYITIWFDIYQCIKHN